MWVCLREGFVSAVQDRYDPGRLVVRARNPEHLKTLFPDDEIVLTPDADYAARVFIRREEFVRVVTQRISEIDYPNFKDSVTDRDLHMLYEEFWMLHFQYQAELSSHSRTRKQR